MPLQIDAVITDAIKDQNYPNASHFGTAKMIWTGTEEEYESIDNPDEQTLYFIVSSGTGSGSVASS